MKKLSASAKFVLVVLLFLSFPGRVFADTDIFFDPDEGTFSEEFDVEIDIDTGVDEINGVSIDLEYSEVEYTSSEDGDLGCSPSVDDGEDGILAITCFIAPGDSFSGQGTLITLTFTPTESGEAVLEITDVTIAGGDEGEVSGATFTIDMDSDTSDELPDTGFFSDNLLLCTGIAFFIIGFLLAAIPDSWNLATLRKKQLEKEKERYEERIKSSAD